MVNKRKSRGRSLSDTDHSLPLFPEEEHPAIVPAAGNRNGTSLNNAGTNGNYWSGTPNEDNDNNAYNLNFNSDNVDWNWNNRNYGRSVRPVSELTTSLSTPPCHYTLTPEQLLVDLYRAYKCARAHKRGKDYQLRFEYRLEDNLVTLRDELYARTYVPRASTCFIIHDPKMREVFAADFRDRIVHHLFYNYTHTLFERTFIADSYSCVPERGTHYGIHRLQHHLRSVTQGYTKPAYVLQIDIRGYFMHINRDILLSLCHNTLSRMRGHHSTVSGKTWVEVIDYDFVDYLLKTIIMCDATDHCHQRGTLSDWKSLPPEKSLFASPDGCGLPIGNLSSQLFSNIYMNVFDQYMKRMLKCEHYGRYVDDSFVVSGDMAWLRSLIPQISSFLQTTLHLDVNPSKVKIVNAYHGVEFLGAYILPHRTYISHNTLTRMEQKLRRKRYASYDAVDHTVNSYLGLLSHHRTFHLRRVLFGHLLCLASYGRFDRLWLRFRPIGK